MIMVIVSEETNLTTVAQEFKLNKQLNHTFTKNL